MRETQEVKNALIYLILLIFLSLYNVSVLYNYKMPPGPVTKVVVVNVE